MQDDATGHEGGGAPRGGGPAATWDQEVVSGLRELQEPGEADLVLELTATFRKDGAATMARLDAAVARGDLEEAVRAAHRMKGGALSLGANKLARAAAELESAARRGEAAALEALAAATRAQWDRFVARIPSHV